ncbi:BsuPI-related putative proteinase inhibitor [Virgibacillus flavescens]|uniref:BsuPI-related putative proteinase inhibitor n=1 Tax=Virgibacillus flavescens TaxID=1611422 RepID=UPI003D329F3F
MKKLIISTLAVLVVLVIIVVLLTGNKEQESVPTSKGEKESENNEETPVKSSENKEGVYATVELEKGSSSSESRLVYTIHNDSDKKITLPFSTSQKYDFRLKDKTGKVIQVYSKGKMFMQVTSEKEVLPGKKLSNSVKLPKLQEGTYTIEMWLTSSYKDKFKQEYQFEIGDQEK